MHRSLCFTVLFFGLVCSAHLCLCSAEYSGGVRYVYVGRRMDTCDATTGECEPMVEVESEYWPARRNLAYAPAYISYDALRRDSVPCSTAGRSYYNCGGSGPANPYNRGCSRITHCYRDTS